MKKTLFLILSCLFLLACPAKILAFSTAGGCKVFNGIATVTWITLDEDGNNHVYGSTGSITEDPSLWMSQEITAGMASPSVTVPHIYINPVTGDLVAVWQYYDTNTYIVRVAAARLPVGTTTWDANVISDIATENGGNYDESASVDEDGNIIVTWSSYNLSTFNFSVRAATAVMDLSSPWNNSFIIPGAGSLTKGNVKRVDPQQNKTAKRS